MIGTKRQYKRMAIFVLAVMMLTVLSGCIGGEETPSSTSTAPTTTPGDDPGAMIPQFPRALAEATPEEEEKAQEIALEDEEVQGVIDGGIYELTVMGCRSGDNGTVCLVLLELENGKEYTITVNMDTNTVERVQEGGAPNSSIQGGAYMEERIKNRLLECEEIQGLIKDEKYELTIVEFNIDRNTTLFSLEIENGKKYLIEFNMEEGTVENIEEVIE